MRNSIKFRFFILDGEMRLHPYRPQYALEEGCALIDFDYEAMSSLEGETPI
jgi:hypothetical protein